MGQKIEAYVLAGGRSSRMGRDKAMLKLGGRTLLSRVVATLKQVQPLEFGGREPRVTLVGERTLLEGADRAVADRHPGSGPLGGMEAALNDLLGTQEADWAFFMPVDMPFLSSLALDQLLREWLVAADEGARVCYAVVDGTPQPLVSLVHKSLHPHLLNALKNRQYKVTPVLQSSCIELASSRTGQVGSTDRSTLDLLWKTTLFRRPAVAGGDWSALPGDEQLRHLWFANLNTEEEFAEAETFFSSQGSIR